MVSRVIVQDVLRANISISPACKAEKRCGELKGTNFTFFASPNVAAATARQTSTSKPVQFPLLSTEEKPGAAVLTPQINCPRALTVSSVEDALACALTANPNKAIDITLNLVCIGNSSFLRKN